MGSLIHKVCSRCKTEKIVDDFTNDKNRVDGKSPWCKKCMAENSRKWYERNREAIIQHQKDNRESINEKRRTYREANRDKLRERQRNWFRQPHIKEKRSIEGKQRLVESWSRIVDYLGGECQICGLKTNHFEVYDCHHLDPTNKKFTIAKKASQKWCSEIEDELDKCVLLCSNCHKMLHVGRFPEIVLIPGNWNHDKVKRMTR